MYGIGGKTSFFGPDLPKPDNVPAQKLSPEDYNKLIDICGDSWRETDYACCDSAQLDQLKENLEKADPLISSCPACKENFHQLFCHFSCSPNQSQFLDIKKTVPANNNVKVVDELDYYVDTSYASNLYDSCKNIKFGLTNGYAMDLIGGGAKNYTQFLKFLGDKKPQIGGSPFQINFKHETQDKDIILWHTDYKQCNDSDLKFACACSDCPQVCPTLPDLPIHNHCEKFGLPCNSFYLVLFYSLLAITYIIFSKYKEFSLKRQKNTTFLTDDNEPLSADYTMSPDITDLSIQSRTLRLYNNTSYVVNNYLEKCFYKIGYFCASKPKLIISTTGLIALLLSSLFYYVQFETNPVNLWVSPNAKSFIEKEMFEESFGPFYRTQQIILSNATHDSILQDYDTIKWWFEKEIEIQHLTAPVTINDSTIDISYKDICLNPLGDSCVIESFAQYFEGDIFNLPESPNWKNKIKYCADSPVECLPKFQQPLKKNLLFGGDKNGNVLTSQAIIITFINNNNNDPQSDQILKATAWEKVLEDYLLTNLTSQAVARGLNISFNTEISLEKELNKSTNTDIRIIVISYLIMFAYASYALSLSHKRKTGMSLINAAFVTPIGKVSGENIILKYLTTTRFTIGLVGIVIVLLSVISSIGFWSYLGLKSTLIIAEVIPFLILAVGVDNIFLISNEFTNVERLSVTNSVSIDKKLAITMANIGPSILLSSTCQFFCFILGSFVGMPAVKNFSLYISVAILFNTLLQITMFVSILSLDQRRIEDGRLDLLPFIKVEQNSVSLPIDTDTSSQQNDDLIDLLNEVSNENESFIKRFFREKYSPFLFTPIVKRFIFFILIIFTALSIALIPYIQLGLDQKIALPSDSYLANYFDDMYSYLDVGPPIYFVVDGLDVTKKDNQQKLCSKFTTCELFSLVNIVDQEYKRMNISTIAEPVASWIDDYLMWLNPDLSDCCRVKRNEPGDVFCSPYDSPRTCDSCFENKPWDYQMHGFPEGDDFMKYFEEWIEAPSYPCPLGGKAPYGSAVEHFNGTIKRSHFRTSHTPLRSQEDFISAYHTSLEIVKEIKRKSDGLEVFAYSPFYIFFAQYESIKILTFTLLVVGLLGIGLVSLFFFGSLRNSFLFVAVLASIMLNILATMTILDISLNAVSLVNLLICLGLSVEFNVHLFKHFNFNDGPISGGVGNSDVRENRAYESLVNIGSTTFGGIALTKLIGISVLSFTRSQIFRIYYFKMWASLVVTASIYALVISPVILGCYGSKKAFATSKWSKVGSDETSFVS